MYSCTALLIFILINHWTLHIGSCHSYVLTWFFTITFLSKMGEVRRLKFTDNALLQFDWRRGIRVTRSLKPRDDELVTMRVTKSYVLMLLAMLRMDCIGDNLLITSYCRRLGHLTCRPCGEYSSYLDQPWWTILASILNKCQPYERSTLWSLPATKSWRELEKNCSYSYTSMKHVLKTSQIRHPQFDRTPLV